MTTDERSISSPAKAEKPTQDVYRYWDGKYQWALFVVTGFGWLADDLWPIVTGLILPPVVQEFQFQGPFLNLGQSIGLLIGAVFWGVGSDIWGRRISFNITLLITGVFALAAGGSPNHVALTSFAALWCIGVGGNLPVDSAIFLGVSPSIYVVPYHGLTLNDVRRIRPKVSPVPPYRPFYMVGTWSAARKRSRLASHW
ncbi:hypothetical protein EDD18DRAFT_1384589 [Armillaria luteobubalina]|uniref:Major facilitator superfamily (MFS) profile domain-containing protein n=1 Tax=Armillaria luteobubalina TaxID=153913 RepID=A0AA39UU63_9AGAR|nr:hypothetical protein EDD18DRAFT_1384589 [Armillaria luteobubalina]